MAYTSGGLAALAYANGFTLWHYKSTSDTVATIMASGYFTGAAVQMLRVGDEMKIQGSDGYWEDTVLTNDGTTVQVGVDPDVVDDSLVGAQFALGTTRKRYDGTEWVYLEGDDAIAAMDVVIIQDAWTTEQLDATNGINSVGAGADLAVVAESISQAIADGDFFWGCIRAPQAAGVKANAVASVEAYHTLFASSTDGHLTDVIDNDAAVIGIVSTEEDDVEPVCVISYPRVVDITNA